MKKTLLFLCLMLAPGGLLAQGPVPPELIVYPSLRVFDNSGEFLSSWQPFEHLLQHGRIHNHIHRSDVQSHQVIRRNGVQVLARHLQGFRVIFVQTEKQHLAGRTGGLGRCGRERRRDGRRGLRGRPGGPRRAGHRLAVLAGDGEEKQRNREGEHGRAGR